MEVTWGSLELIRACGGEGGESLDVIGAVRGSVELSEAHWWFLWFNEGHWRSLGLSENHWAQWAQGGRGSLGLSGSN